MSRKRVVILTCYVIQSLTKPLINQIPYEDLGDVYKLNDWVLNATKSLKQQTRLEGGKTRTLDLEFYSDSSAASFN